MEDFKPAWMQILFFVLALLTPGLAQADLEYVSVEQRQVLREAFASGAALGLAELRGKWKCDLFGVRTNLQVKRDLELYAWTGGDKPGLWKNQGAQLITDYRMSQASLIGATEQFEDEVKLTTNGILISQLTLLKPSRTILAYALCRNVSVNIAAFP